MSIISGEIIKRSLTKKDIESLSLKIKSTLSSNVLSPSKILELLDGFVKKLTVNDFCELEKIITKMGFNQNFSREILKFTISSFSKDSILKRFDADFSTTTPFECRHVGENVREKFVPLGVVTHITASNSPVNPIVSLLDGIVTGNINIVKLPFEGNLFAEKFIEMFLGKVPELKQYVYILNISSSETELMRETILLADGVAVWGSDKAVEGVRKMMHPNQRMIFWGNKLSLAYVSRNEMYNEEKLVSICRDVCLTNQLACNSPQCVLVETKNNDELTMFSDLLGKCMNEVSGQYPTVCPDVHEQSEITTQLMLAKVDEIFGEKYVVEDKLNSDWRIIADFKTKLRVSPLFRTILIFPIKRQSLHELLFSIRRYLQTVVLSCDEKERDCIQEMLIRSGASRICYPGEAHSSYVGEPHDGERALTRFVRCVRTL